jgi:hypothetical protein
MEPSPATPVQPATQIVAPAVATHERRRRSGGATPLHIKRSQTWCSQLSSQLTGENFLYVFKGAHSAPSARWPSILDCAARARADLGGAQRRHGAGLQRRNRLCPAPPAALWPWRATAASAHTCPPRGRLHRLGVVANQRRRACLQEVPSLRRLILKPCKITVKGTPAACRCAIPSGPWTVILARDSGAPIGAMARSER